MVIIMENRRCHKASAMRYTIRSLSNCVYPRARACEISFVSRLARGSPLFSLPQGGYQENIFSHKQKLFRLPTYYLHTCLLPSSANDLLLYHRKPPLLYITSYLAHPMMIMMKSEGTLRNLFFLCFGMFIGFTNNISTDFIIGRRTRPTTIDTMNTDSAHYHHHYHHLEEQIQNDYNAKLLKQIGLYEEASAAATQQIQILKRRFDDNLANQAKMYEGKLAKAMQQQQQKPLPPPEVIPLRVRVSVGSSLTNTVSDGGGSGGDIPFVVPQFSKNPPAGIAAAISYPLSYYPFTLHGHDYFLPAHGIDRPAVQAFLNNVYFEPQTHCAMAKLLHCYPGSMVHAGTFFGDMIPHFSNIIKNVSSTSTTKTTAPDHDHHHHHPYQLYAFEPNTRNYLLAQKAVEANELSNVILVNAALGPFVMQQRIQVEASSANNDKDQSLQQHSGKKTPPKLLGGDSSVSPTTGTQRVPQLTIDMFNITNLSIIALDVQDYEVFVLQGGMRTLKNPATRPRVVALEDADLKRPAAAFMQEYLPEYVFITRMDCLSYFALENVYIEVKTLLQECSSAS